MSKKTAQSVDLDGFHIDSDDLDKFLSEDLKDRGDVKFEVDLDEADLSPRSLHDLEILPAEDFIVEIPLIPGAEDQTDVDEEEVEVEDKGDKEEVEVEHDPWKWNLSTFPAWVADKMKNVPRHTGRDISGCERALAFCQRVAGEIPKATRMDFDNILDIDALEQVRCELFEAVDRLEERIEKLKRLKNPKKNKKKKADVESGEMVKSARLSIGDMQYSIPYIIAHIARLIVDSSIKNGKDAEDTYKILCKQFELDKREKAQVLRLLDDMQFMTFKDLGLDPDAEEFDPQSEENIETIVSRYN